MSKIFLEHEAMKFGKINREPEQGLVHQPYPLCGAGRRRISHIHLPCLADAFKNMLRHRLPENIFRPVMVGDKRMLQSDPLRNATDARSLEALRCKFRERCVQNCRPCFLRPLLLCAPEFCRTALLTVFLLDAVRCAIWLLECECHCRDARVVLFRWALFIGVPVNYRPCPHRQPGAGKN